MSANYMTTLLHTENEIKQQHLIPPSGIKKQMCEKNLKSSINK